MERFIHPFTFGREAAPIKPPNYTNSEKMYSIDSPDVGDLQPWLEGHLSQVIEETECGRGVATLVIPTFTRPDRPGP